jgi:hypothetical protein
VQQNLGGSAKIEMPVRVQISYKEAIDSIVFAKKQQWVFTNYVVVIYAAIFAISIRYHPSGDTKIWLKVLVVLAFFYGAYLIFKLQYDLSKLRDRLTYIHATYFTPNERIELGLTAHDRPFWYEPGIWLLLAISFVGAWMALYFL